MRLLLAVGICGPIYLDFGNFVKVLASIDEVKAPQVSTGWSSRSLSSWWKATDDNSDFVSMCQTSWFPNSFWIYQIPQYLLQPRVLQILCFFCT
ncbi:unnamed protein product [Ambrosiozyma monospora]|uniref:Unnamed protein product n=1 Tax=Ambrosiozyma monospora TaxID=43982 RepID=A0A9W7DGK9_AMBMO|nr:unnamed protein product [Ambrosiozyma monospora]